MNMHIKLMNTLVNWLIDLIMRTALNGLDAGTEWIDRWQSTVRPGLRRRHSVD